MFQKIYVPVDNSGHSNRAIDQALALGGSYGAKLVGCHVYAARMHDYRFKQMEFTLPEEYLVETELARQRKIHDSLITMGSSSSPIATSSGSAAWRRKRASSASAG
jgi:nucleotide-binding universal stress UspA family protein